MNIIRYTWLWLTISALLVAGSITAYFTIGLKLSADFTEGSLYEIEFAQQSDESTSSGEAMMEEEKQVMSDVVTQEQLRTAVDSYEAPEGKEPIGNVEIKQSGPGHFTLRMKRLEPVDQDSFLNHIDAELGKYELVQARDVSPTFARTFRDRAIVALIAASLMIILYITFTFRKVSRGIKSWKLGVAAIFALIHDVVIVLGVFVVLGHYYQVEVDALFITALLSVMGYSVNDTIVVFDRLRENLFIRERGETFDDVANKSLNQTMARSVNTSFSTLIVLLALLELGATELYYFVLALVLGIVVGTYSSIFLATPLLTVMRSKQD